MQKILEQSKLNISKKRNAYQISVETNVAK